jgi:hypothetical protein
VTCPHADLFSGVGRRWLTAQALPADEWRSVDALIRPLDFHGDELAAVERDVAIHAIDDPIVARLMAMPGIDVTVAVAIVAAVDDFSRFDSPDRLVSYLGLTLGFASPATPQRSTVGSPKAAQPKPVGCSSKRRLPHPRPRDRCGRSIAGSSSGEVSRSPPSPSPAR